MRLYLILSIAFLAIVNTSLGSVGGAGISDATNSLMPQETLTGTSLQAGSTQPTGTQTYVYPLYASSGYPNTAAEQPSLGPVSQVAPTPPNPNGEGLVMPDFNLYRPTSQPTAGYNYPAPTAGNQQSAYPGRFPAASIAGSPAYAGAAVPGAAIANPAASGFPVQTVNAASTVTRSTVITSGVSSSSPYGTPFGSSAASVGGRPPAGYMAQGGYNAVYPRPSVCKCNEYYVQGCPGGDLDTVAGVFCGEWLPLWSKISRPGDYWSYEWKICGSEGYGSCSPYVNNCGSEGYGSCSPYVNNCGSEGYGSCSPYVNNCGCGGSGFCSPEVRNFGYKCAGWHQTWFKGDDLGWHILSYHSNDWSNYIYIYVWPKE